MNEENMTTEELYERAKANEEIENLRVDKERLDLAESLHRDFRWMPLNQCWFSPASDPFTEVTGETIRDLIDAMKGREE